MLRKRVLAAALGLCLLAGAAVPAWAEEETSAPRTNVPASEKSGASGGTPEIPEAPETLNPPEGGPDSAGYYALEPPAPGAALLAAGEKPSIVDSGSCGGNLTWTLDSEGTLTISGTGQLSSSSGFSSHRSGIKAVVCQPGVTGIGSSVFYSTSNPYRNLQSVDLPESAVSIGDSAFRSCSALSSVTLRSGLVSIGDYAFRYCSNLREITIPGTVSSMGDYAFESSGVTGVIFQEGPTQWGGTPLRTAKA